MTIKTSIPVIKDRSKITAKIAGFWNQISEGWLMVWGPHIHHGYYDSDEELTPIEAQERLLEKIIGIAGIKNGARILDVGCGLGGSSIYLSKRFKADVTGITLSSKQVRIAKSRAEEEMADSVVFRIEDAQSMKSIDDHTFDIIWSLESCEQFFDKGAFIEQASRVLKKKGKLILVTWCSSSEEYKGRAAKRYKKLCEAFDLPYMPTVDYYQSELISRGFSIDMIDDWSEQVQRSWDIGISLVSAYSILKIIKTGGVRGLIFTRQLRLMRHAFRMDMIRYSVYICTK